jgi:competence protein ComEC
MDALALLLGVTAIQFAPGLPRGWPWAAIALLLVVPVAWRTCWRPCLFLLLGLIYATARAQLDLSHRWPPRAEPLVAQVDLAIDSLVLRRDHDAQFEGRVLQASAPIAVRRLRVSWYDAPPLRAGQRWRLSLTLRAPRGLRNPHGYDAEGRWLHAGIGALGSVNARIAPLLLEPARTWTLLHLRESLSTRLAGFAAGNPSAGVITGLAVGDTAAVPPSLWSVFRATGITHLMAISGTHVGMFGVLSAAIVRRGWRWSRRRHHQQGSQTACVLAAMGGSAAYALLAGFSVPSQRTALMIGVAGLARLRSRHLPATRALALALMAVLLLDPAAGLQAGFWLSFGTVAWIIAAETGAAAGPAWRSELRLQWGVPLLVLPTTLYCFGQASLMAAPVNLIAVPLTGLLIVPLIVLAAVLAMPVPALAQAIVVPLAAALDRLWPLLQQLAQWPGAQWSSSMPLGLTLLATLAAAAASLAPVWSWRCLALAAMLAPLAWKPPQPDAHGFELTLLDAGDVTLAVLLTQRSTIVYFAGSGSALAGDVADSVLLPHLRGRGRSRVDVLFVSRADSAHAAGIEALWREMPVVQMLGGGDPDAPCLDGQVFDRDGIAIRVIGPLAGAASSRNASCVLRIAGAGASVLLGGEIDAQGEQTLLARGALQPVTLVVVPARGSHLASSTALVNALQPRWAVIVAAHLNRFGYPRPEVVSRWRTAGAAVRQVSQEGAITLQAPARGPARLPPGERLARPRYWTAK